MWKSAASKWTGSYMALLYMRTQSSLYIHLVTPIQTCVFQWVSASYLPFTNIWHANWSSQTFALVDELLDFLSYTDSAESWRPRRIMHRNIAWPRSVILRGLSLCGWGTGVPSCFYFVIITTISWLKFSRAKTFYSWICCTGGGAVSH